jgi:hypothetical protein
MATTTELAQVDSASAYLRGDDLILRAAGTKPTPCYEVSIEELPMTIFPPEFAVTWTSGAALCAQVVTPYEVVQQFSLGSAGFEKISLHTAGGTLELPVEQIPEARAVAEGSPIPSGPVEAVGYSDSWDLGEAMKDAIASLPDRGAGIPDWLSTYRVLEIGAEVGGIAGWNRMRVRVQG